MGENCTKRIREILDKHHLPIHIDQLSNLTTQEKESIVMYISEVLSNFSRPVMLEFTAWPGFSKENPDQTDFVLDCREMLNRQTPQGFQRKMKNDNVYYQFDLRGILEGKGLVRPHVWRLLFIDDDNYTNRTFTGSHLCHNPQCVNPDHIIFEPLEINKARNGCPGGTHCHHKIACIRPGPFYDK